MITLLLHVANSEPIKVDVDEMPKPTRCKLLLEKTHVKDLIKN